MGPVDELARLRRRQQELNEALAAAAEPTPPQPPQAAPEPTRSPAALKPSEPVDNLTAQQEDVNRIQGRLDALEARRPGPEMGLSR